MMRREKIVNPCHCGPKPILTPAQIVEAKRVRAARWRFVQEQQRQPRFSGQPTDRALAEQWGVSVAVVRRAMNPAHFGWAYRHVTHD
jgi:hypothetical protein